MAGRIAADRPRGPAPVRRVLRTDSLIDSTRSIAYLHMTHHAHAHHAHAHARRAAQASPLGTAMARRRRTVSSEPPRPPPACARGRRVLACRIARKLCLTINNRPKTGAVCNVPRFALA